MLAAVPAVADESDAASATYYASALPGSSAATTVTDATTEAKAVSIETIFGGTGNALADGINDGDRIVLIGQFYTSSVKPLTINKGVTIVGQDTNGVKAGLHGYAFTITATTGTVAISNLSMDDTVGTATSHGSAADTAQTINASAKYALIGGGENLGTHNALAINVAISNVDLKYTQDVSVETYLVHLQVSGTASITGSTFTYGGDATAKVQAAGFSDSSAATFTGNTVSGTTRGVNFESTKAITTGSNDISLNILAGSDTKVYNIATDNSDSALTDAMTVRIGQDRALNLTYPSTAYINAVQLVTLEDKRTTAGNYKLASFVSALDTYIVGGTVTVTGTMEIAADTEVITGSTLAVAGGATLTVDSGKSLLVSGTFTTAAADSTSSSATAASRVVLNGTIAKLSTATVTDDAKAIEASAIKTAYTLTYGEDGVVKYGTDSKEVLSISGTKSIAYAGETVSVKVYSIESGYKASTVYATVDSANVKAVSTDANTYSLTLPATITQTDTITLTANVAGAYSVTPILVDSTGKEISRLSTVNNLLPTTTYAVALAGITPTADGYRFQGWYTDAAATKELDTTENLTASTAVYALMGTVLNVTVSDATGGSVVATPDSGTVNDEVTVTVTPASGYRFNSLTVNGQTVAKYSTVSASTYNGTNPVYKDSVLTYTFVLTKDSTVSAVFDKLYTVKTSETTGDAGDLSIVAFASDRAITAPTEPITLVTQASTYAKGDTVYVYALMTVSTATAKQGLYSTTVTGATATIAGQDSLGTAISNSSASTTTYDYWYVVKFTMPGEDATVSATYGPTVGLTFTPSPSNGTVTVNGQSTSPIARVAVGSTVTVVLTPTNATYGVKSLKITDGTDALEVGLSDPTYNTTKNTYTYTFTMPNKDATVDAEFGPVKTIADVTTIGGGSVTKPIVLKGTEGAEFNFTVRTTEGVSLKQITVTTGSVDANGVFTKDSTNAETVYAVVATDGATTITASSTDIRVSGSTYIFTMGEKDVTIEFEFEATVYVPISDVAVTGNGAVAVYESYNDTTGALSGLVDPADYSKLTADTYYIVLTAEEGSKITSVRAFEDFAITYTPSNSSAAVSATDSQELTLTVMKASEDYAIYAVTTSASYTPSTAYSSAGATADSATSQSVRISAGFEVLTFTVTIGSSIAHGSIALQDANGTAVASGSAVAYGTVLTIVPSADKGYDVSRVTYKIGTAEAQPVLAENDVYSYTVKDNVTLAAEFAEAYAVNLPAEQTGYTITADKDEAAQGTTVTLTLTLASGYEKPVVAVADAYGVAQTVTTVAADKTYTFVMPSSAATVTVTVEKSAAPSIGVASAVIVSLVYDPENNNAPSVMLVGVGGYVPAGTVTLTVYFMQNGAAASAHVTITVPEDQTTNVVKVALSDGVSEVSATTVAAVASYAGGDLTAMTTGFQGFVATLTASAATQE